MAREQVSESAVLVAEEIDGHTGVISIQYVIADAWNVTLEMELERLDDAQNFTRLTFELSDTASAGPDLDITNRLLRLIPFRDAHQRASRQVRSYSTSDVPPPPETYEDMSAYARLARSFMVFDRNFPDQPLKQMAEQFEINRSTLAARVNRAKDMGLLVRPSKQEPFELSERARELLQEGGS